MKFGGCTFGGAREKWYMSFVIVVYFLQCLQTDDAQQQRE